MDKKFEKQLMKNFPKEKVDNYLKYVEMVKEKKKFKKQNIEKNNL